MKTIIHHTGKFAFLIGILLLVISIYILLFSWLVPKINVLWQSGGPANIAYILMLVSLLFFAIAVPLKAIGTFIKDGKM